MAQSRSLAVPVESAAPVGSTASAFERLDELVRGERATGVARVLAPPSALGAVLRHLERRVAYLGRRFVSAGVTAVREPWRELARAVGVGCDASPREVAGRVARTAAGAVVVVGEHGDTAWGRAFRETLCALADQPDTGILLVLLGAPDASGRRLRAGLVDRSQRERTFELDLATMKTGLWWAALIAHDAHLGRGPFDQVVALDAWWESVVAQGEAPADPCAALSELARRLLSLALLAEQPLPTGVLAALGRPASGGDIAAALDELRHARLLVSSPRLGAGGAGEVLTPRAGLEASASVRALRDDEHYRGLAIALSAGAVDVAAGAVDVGAVDVAAGAVDVAAGAVDVAAGGDPDSTELGHPDDPWRWARSAELFAAANDAEEAERAAFRALRHARDAAARDDIWGRWERALELLRDSDPRHALARTLRAAEEALALGDGDRADSFASEALRLDSDHFDVLLVHGRARAARGDVTTSALSLRRALTVAPGPAEAARAAGALAQMRFMAGDREQARRYAEDAIAGAVDVTTRLAARNVIGKLLLAGESWAEAEEHFAHDAYDAARQGDDEAELRARLNRGIAVLYLGRREDARAMLEGVLADGERRGVLRAVTYTLSNLATLAILRHDYDQALVLSERAIAVRRQIGERAGLVQPITNLAELRLRLGMLEEAEQGLRFGLQAAGDDLPLSRYAYFAKVSAAIHVERGHTRLAAKEIALAIAGASGAGDRAMLAQCHRISARIALDDGDVVAAEAALERARLLRHTAFGAAELAVLEAMQLRAKGEAFLAAASQALDLAREADDPESQRQAHLLRYHAFRLEGASDAAAAALAAALGERDRVASSLPEALRERYVAKPSLEELARLEAGGSADDDDDDATSKPEPYAVRSARSIGPAAPAQRRALVGETLAMRSLRATVERFAHTDATVLITGETGTGKELVAEALHRASPRSQGPLVKVNCAALVETLLLSELFGHEKGAFTGASARRRGRFEVADGGTLFLDEIGDISPRTQVALLRVLQDGTFERVGGCTPLRANVRIVCATHRDLRAMVEQGTFRQDLYYRLCGVSLEVPALRERLTDLPLLARALLERLPGVEVRELSEAAMRALARHPWPGNVRELENALRVASLFGEGKELGLEAFVDNVDALRYLGEVPDSTQRARVSSSPSEGWLGGPDTGGLDTLPPPTSSTELVYAEVRSGTRLAEMKKRLEQDCIERALIESGGNITQAATLLGMKRPRLSQLVKQYKLQSVLEDITS